MNKGNLEFDILLHKVHKMQNCCEELKRVTELMDDPTINNTRTLEEAIKELKEKVVKYHNALEEIMLHNDQHYNTCVEALSET